MAMSQVERDEVRAEKAARLMEVDLRLKVRPSTRPALAELMRWGKIGEQGEALTLMIHHVQGLGLAGVARLMRTPRHKIEYRGNVAPIIQVAELRLRARPGTVQALEELQEWIGTEHHGATLALLIDRLHDLGSAQALPMLAMPPRPKYVIPTHFAARLQRAYQREALRICREE
jgi:hypothetical protein